MKGNESRGFVYNGADLYLEKTPLVESKCAGAFGDRQRIDEVKLCSMCGCFSTKALSSSVVSVWILTVVTSTNGVKKVIRDYTSLKAFQLFTKGR